MSLRNSIGVWFALGLAGLVLCAGCGNDGEEPMESSNKEVPISSLVTFINTSSDKFISEMNDIPEIRDAPRRLVLELGTIEIDRSTMTRSDYEMVQHAVRGRLLDSRVITDNFMIVQNKARSRADRDLVEIDTPEDTDITQENPDTGSGDGMDRYNPDDIYTLNGTFERIGRSERAMYLFQLSLVKWKSRHIVLNKSYQQVIRRDK